MKACQGEEGEVAEGTCAYRSVLVDGMVDPGERGAQGGGPPRKRGVGAMKSSLSIFHVVATRPGQSSA